MAAKKYLSTSEIARICQVTPVTVGNWIRSGKLKASRVPGGNYRVTPRNLAALLRDAHILTASDLFNAEPRVLILAADEESLQQIVQALTGSDKQLHIDTAADCLTAGAKIARTEPDLVILKLPMVGFDHDLCRRIRQTQPSHDMKLLVISPITSKALTDARQIGADAYLPADFTARNLRTLVSELLCLE